MKRIAVLGSTGSIGTQTLEIVRTNKDIKITALAAGNNIELLEKQIREAATLVAVEDLYRPYKPKRRTRAMIAREKGLESLANVILLQNLKEPVEKAAEAYISVEKGVESVQDAINGAMDILAEGISDDDEGTYKFHCGASSFHDPGGRQYSGHERRKDYRTGKS